MNIVRDMSLQEHGRMKIRWVQDFMPAFGAIKKEFEKTKPFAGKTIAMSIHMEAKTAYLATVLKAAGAEVYATGCNPLSTQHDVAAGVPCVIGKNGVEEILEVELTDEEQAKFAASCDILRGFLDRAASLKF